MGFPNTFRIAHVVKFVLRIILPFEIRAIAPLYFNDYAARRFLAAVSTCTPICRCAMMCLYLKASSI